jgi:hypothetical protein
MPLDAKPAPDPKIIERRNAARMAFFNMRHALERVVENDEISEVISRDLLQEINEVLGKAEGVSFLDIA